LKAGTVDLVELRVDHFASNLGILQKALPRLTHPLIITVRHPREGGAGELSFGQRAELYRGFLAHATYLDVELRSMERLHAICAEARAAGVTIIGSYHDFRRTPTLDAMLKARDQAAALGADLFKIAAHAETATDLGRLLALLSEGPAGAGGSKKRRDRAPLPLAVMGMGPLGKISRLLLARTGSRLNYGYLDEPQVSGQWEATILKKRLAELAE
jgi:3-dehydroquinate dehydratase-1